jgi:hypothetical protein
MKWIKSELEKQKRVVLNLLRTDFWIYAAFRPPDPM